MHHSQEALTSLFFLFETFLLVPVHVIQELNGSKCRLLLESLHAIHFIHVTDYLMRLLQTGTEFTSLGG